MKRKVLIVKQLLKLALMIGGIAGARCDSRTR